MLTHRTEGIILNALNFQDYDQILTVFSPTEGIIKFMYKGAHTKRAKGATTSPLTRAEFVYSKSKGDLLKCREISLINQNLQLRENLQFLEIACELVKDLQMSQLSGKPAPDLYKLLITYLEKIPLMPDPYVLSASFRLKILRHEGLYGFGPACTACQIPLTNYYVAGGETFCSMHAPPSALMFTHQEAELMTQLAFSRTFSELANLSMNPNLDGRIKLFFKEQLQ